MKKLLAIFILASLSCNQSNEKIKAETESKKPTDSTSEAKSHSVKKYFDYDQIDHYFNDFDNNKSLELIDNRNTTPIDSIKAGVLLSGIPKTIDDTLFITQLEKAEFKKNVISAEEFPKIDKIFTERPGQLIGSASKCVAIYRDVLIFKKQKKIIGIAKICFRCGQEKIIGTSANTNNFGQNGDYEKLESILR